ncbi:hypothetical protein LSUE1_G002990 [Lachnellula suecica]|uniref:Uncharacterized protein n=1 Tax=Lachnellula suecica TaxID=602035 RepID=A0A8T9C7S1_9HELO|nr:hypothetical protein LSUE1_G002990 [Lachnellula suecica]
MPPKIKPECTVPLHCSLCPKNPNFSDISHLLTHLSSKSHLANLFKLRIRSQGEEEAKEKLENFEFWYSQNNLDVLLSDRLAIKDHKNAKKEKRNRASNASRGSVKKEENAAESTLDRTPVFRAPVPRMHRWNGDSEPTDEDWGQNSLYDTPTSRRQVPNFTEDETPRQSRSMLDPKLNPSRFEILIFIATMSPTMLTYHNRLKTPSKASVKKSSKNADKVPESAQLKGILWPGMDLFDSATPDMKRMRNQRKDSNVMRQMMATSAEIEPAEISYFADGEFRGSRDIFGPLSGENSPVKEPSPKKPRRSRKPTFSDLSVNAPVPRSRASRGRRSAKGKSPEKRQPPMHDSAPAAGLLLRPAPILNPLAPAPSFGQAFAPTLEEDDEFKMTVGEVKKKRNFGVFQDGPGESPSDQTESSLEDHRFDFPNHGLPLFPNNSTATSHTSPTPAPKHVSGRSQSGFGKENMQHLMHSRHPASYPSHVYPPQVFYNPSFNPLYNHAYAGSFGYGDHHNFHELKAPIGLHQNFYPDFKQTTQPSRAAQPKIQPGNATISSESSSGSAINDL